MRRVSYRAEDNVRQWTTSEPRIGARVMVDPTAMVLGDISLGDDVSIWANCSIRADMHRISIGSGSNIQDNSVLHITHAGRFNPSGCPLVIGEQVTVGHRAVLHGCSITADHNSIHDPAPGAHSSGNEANGWWSLLA